MMRIIELTNKEGDKYLFEMTSGWEIYDKGEEPAQWVNHIIGRNMDAIETYTEVKGQFIPKLINLPIPPNRPLTRNIKEGCGVGICPKCGSTVERKRFFSKEKVCIHPECDFTTAEGTK